ncbi:MAG: hypothetical protein IKO20_04125 [Bacteroidaceae bacterium]|nr:hypothetical protein [Bacteroidaceae bacterium]
MQKLQHVRNLAQKAANLTGEPQALIRKGEAYDFTPLANADSNKIEIILYPQYNG